MKDKSLNLDSARAKREELLNHSSTSFYLIMPSILTQFKDFLRDRLTPKLPDLSQDHNDSLYYARGEGEQSIVIANVKKELIIENCLKYLYNKQYNKLIYNRIFDNGINFKFERMRGLADYWDIGVYQEGENVKLVMQYSNQLFPDPSQDSIMYLDLVKSVYRRLTKEIPPSTIEQLSKYPRGIFRKF